jgi:hypothetical protein
MTAEQHAGRRAAYFPNQASIRSSERGMRYGEAAIVTRINNSAAPPEAGLLKYCLDLALFRRLSLPGRLSSKKAQHKYSHYGTLS